MYKWYKTTTTAVLLLLLATACNSKQGGITTTEIPTSSSTPNAEHIAPINVKSFGFGAKASVTEIAGWNIDIRPDGTGLPKGKGTAEQGENLYVEKCSVCHGDFGEGVNRWPLLSGGTGSLITDEPEKSVGSYWPYTSTLFDYINRAMPYFAPQSLAPDEVYKIVAYILYLNDIIEPEFEINQNNLASIKLVNEGNFYPKKDNYLKDHRENDIKNKICMSNCIEGNIKVIESLRGVTPDQDKSRGEL